MNNHLNIINLWLRFSFDADDVEFDGLADGEEAVCRFKYRDKDVEFNLQYIEVKSDSFLYSKQTFEKKNVIQITPNYIGIIIADKVKRHLMKYKKFITKDDSGYMKVPFKIAEEAVHIVKLEDVL